MGGKAADDQKRQDLIFQQQQNEIQAAHDREVAANQMAWAKQQADNAAAQQKKADEQRYYDENLSPEAQAKQAAAMKASDDALKSDMAFGADLLEAGYMSSRGGLTTMGMGMGMPVVGGLLAMMGFTNPQPQQPSQNGPTPPQNNNNFTITI